MSESFKIRVGSKSSKGTIKEDNDDRILIGMDPAANDWLFSPDPVQVGEFGTVILLADGIGDNAHGGSAANTITKTIRKLFDETLELPPHEDELLALLIKFFQIAQKQLQLYASEHTSHRHMGTSVSLVVLHENKAFLVWLGNCRVYRFCREGVAGSFLNAATNLESLTVDHSYKVEKLLFENEGDSKYIYPEGLSKYVSSDIITEDISSCIVSLEKNDRLLICSEGVFLNLKDSRLSDILAEANDPEIAANDLISQAFNNGSEQNISAVVVDILDVLPMIPPIARVDSKKPEYARVLYGPKMATELTPKTANQDDPESLKPEKKKSTKFAVLPPIRLRTVMPDSDIETTSSGEKSSESTSETASKQAEQMELEWPAGTKVEEKEEITHNLKETDKTIHPEKEDEAPKEDDQLIPLKPESSSEPMKDEFAERLARLKIKMTVYPDLDEQKDVQASQPDQEKNISDQETSVTKLHSDADEEIQEEESADSKKLQGKNDMSDTLDMEDEIPISANDEEREAESYQDEIVDEELQEEPRDESENDDEIHASTTRISPASGTPVKEETDIKDDMLPEEEEFFVRESMTNQESAKSGQYAAAQTRKYEAEPAVTNVENTTAPERKARLWPYFAVLGLLIMIPIWICRDNSDIHTTNSSEEIPASISLETENPKNDAVAETSPEETDENEAEQEIEDSDDAVQIPASTDMSREKVVTKDPETNKPEAPAQKKEVEKKSKNDTKEPNYDPEVEKNKHQLLGEVQSLLQRKNQLCRQISTYGKNAPSGKSESISQLQNKCDQLGQKFGSIYNQKSGYFKTVRYDFMSGTIKSIRVSMDQIDQQFEAIRGE